MLLPAGDASPPYHDPALLLARAVRGSASLHSSRPDGTPLPARRAAVLPTRAEHTPLGRKEETGGKEPAR